MHKIMLIEDYEGIRTELADIFRKNQYEVCFPETFDSPEDEEKIIAMFEWEKPELILLDINLQSLDGFAICRRIRQISEVPVLFVTARNSDEDELRAIRTGGDDFIRKPYNIEVLLAKAERIFARTPRPGGEQMEAGGVTLDVIMSQIRYGDRQMEVSKNELKILYCLFANRGKIISKDRFIEYLWENKYYVDENIFDVNLSRLRKRLGEIGLGKFIETVPRKGYRIGAPDEDASVSV